MKRFILALACCLFCAVPAWADGDRIELLRTNIMPETSRYLTGLACRNFGWIVHLDITVDWPENDVRIEEQFHTDTLVLQYTGSKKTVHDIDNDSNVEFYIMSDQPVSLKGHYKINGYYFVQNGSGYQGVWNLMFYPVERLPSLPEIPRKDSFCPPHDIPPDIH